MNRQDLLASFRSRGLRAWQANFAASFLDIDAGAYHLLAAPPGTGKTYVSVAIATELAKRQSTRMLILAPASLCEQWLASLYEAQSTIPVLLVTRRVFREMEAALPIGQLPWKSDGIYVISLDLAKQDDFALGLSAGDWDLVIVDEAHLLAAPQRAALLDRLLAPNVVHRLLLLSAMPLPALDKLLNPTSDEPPRFPSPLVFTNWYGELKNWDGSTLERSSVHWNVFGYKRDPDEVKCLSLFLRRKNELEAVSGGNKLLVQMLTQRASSSLFAFEQSLQRLKHTLRSATEEAELFVPEDSTAQSVLLSELEDTESSAPNRYSTWIDKSAGLAIVDECLEALDMISVDEKLISLKRLIRSIVGVVHIEVPRICVFSMFAETLSYLHTALEDVGVSLFKVTGTLSFADRRVTIDRFLHEGGLILGTDAALSEGIAMVQVSDVIHYDLPLNPLKIKQRCGRFDRLGRHAPLTMHLLFDESGVMPSESELVQAITSEKEAESTKC